MQGFKEVAAQERKVIAAEEEVPRMLTKEDQSQVLPRGPAMVVFWSTSIICSVAGCNWYTSLGEELKEKLEMMKLHEMLADPHPEEEAISKIVLMSLLE